MPNSNSMTPEPPTRAAHALAGDAPFVLREDAGGVATLTLNRPASRNALSMGMLEALAAELDRAGADPSVRVVVLAGAGPAFCAGHDLKEMRAAGYACSYSEPLFAECVRVMTAIVHHNKPVIARVHGIATAAGCQLVASCDLAVAAADARFATPGVNIGLFCSTPMVALSRNVGRKAAMRMLLTGDLVDADSALRMGLLSDVVPAAELATRTHELAVRIAAKSAVTLAIGKRAFYEQVELPLAEAYAHASRAMVANLAQADAHEGIDAFLEKRSPRWPGR
jgi:enoyl-CoA hydratase/carnithine racemase